MSPSISTPPLVKPSDTFAPPDNVALTAIAPGIEHVCGIETDGSLHCWGNDDAGSALPPPGKFRSVAAGFYNNCGIRDDGNIRCWAGSTTYRLKSPIGHFIALAIGFEPEPDSTDTNNRQLDYACAIRTDHTLHCWGDGAHAKTTPPAGTFSALSLAADHACALRTDGSIACWGNPGIAWASIPAGKFATVSTLARHTCGLRPNGRLQCWGEFRQPVQ